MSRNDTYETPPASELQRLLWVKAGTSGHLDEVHPGIYIGDIAAGFIRTATSSLAGKVLVHCAMGLSRSSSLVLAYLMIHEKMTLVEAIKAIAQHRNICPNHGFIEQLRELDRSLHCPSKGH
ncbi:hypothetical protein DNTS_027183 [Danionella cerebrum]|uniref:Uncharacterized protein n=1 Tax=Danionella cerebrum TaxID=2873325 RepID=A0A553N2Z3_9TELE|nr:hypothetical protein DNTS_027183 [Danionella translucida]